MNFIHIYILVLLVTLSACGDIKKQYYDNGNLKEEYETYFYIPHGYYKSYYPNGNLKIFYYHKYSKKDGPFKYYFENGNLLNDGYYKNDSIVKMEAYDKEGLLISEHLTNTRFKTYQYFKNKNIYKVEYLRSFVNGKTNELGYVLQDSCTVYAFRDVPLSSEAGYKKILTIRYYNDDSKIAVLNFFSEEGELIRKDTMNMGKDVELIKKQILGKDTVEIGYIPDWGNTLEY